ncbi:peptidylprolyl isomerase [Pseudomonas sp. H9]|uniref:peptidylprolyl isomerase n=1 Tax=Pseudomonas sp. H9 TaxID=483968 RepID=UPI00105781A0|nr:peptidylprolyl isomerase [Pseudomonas sp. H9]TDF82604.1 peptidylprolyl isomerase [Pseudomonas sp. H9]
MSRRVVLASGGVLAIAAVAITLVLRPGEAPVAASAVSPAGEVVARLGDQQVDANDLNALFEQLPQASRQQLRGDRAALETWLRARLAEKALYQQAEAKGWSQRPEVQAQTRAAVEQIVLRSYLNSMTQVPEDYPSEQDLTQAYEASKATLQVPAVYRVSQIFLSVPDAQATQSVRDQAQALSKRAHAAGADFAELARTYSQDPGSAAQGGDIGPQPLAQLLPEVRGVVTRLKVGEVSEPLQSSLGFHVIKLTESQPARIATLDEVRGQLREALRAQRQEQAAKQYVDDVLNLSTLSIDGAALNKALEAQR